MTPRSTTPKPDLESLITELERDRHSRRKKPMKAIFGRLRLLEEKVVNHEIEGLSIADVPREHKRRRLESMGLPYVEPWRDPALYANGRCPTAAEVLRSHRPTVAPRPNRDALKMPQ